MNAGDPEVQESSLILFNVLICEQTIEKDLWLEKSEQLKLKAMKSGLYPMRSLVMTIESLQEDDRKVRFTFYLLLNGTYECRTQDHCRFEASLMIDHSLMIATMKKESLFRFV
ncbi:hypothetical protein NIE88_00390 [Sporolactobacillus shoreicorticis]|uniref:Uncharacterized protein n=1 Tax=Sporolactobacillus shoreicorticis TaxID=1923877 RepID=A0ABW5S515_9BACL|nr:hypothetical protein [Sporolactobacillus shoreicorticis]MCO7124248.1 hypothetical protein [Sporolactobacillus shoreicorticis]